jgi:hypothetical protein
VTKLSFYQIDPPMSTSFWQKDSLITHILFELCLIWYLAYCQIHRITLYSLGITVYFTHKWFCNNTSPFHWCLVNDWQLWRYLVSQKTLIGTLSRLMLIKSHNLLDTQMFKAERVVERNRVSKMWCIKVFTNLDH